MGGAPISARLTQGDRRETRVPHQVTSICSEGVRALCSGSLGLRRCSHRPGTTSRCSGTICLFFSFRSDPRVVFVVNWCRLTSDSLNTCHVSRVSLSSRFRFRSGTVARGFCGFKWFVVLFIVFLYAQKVSGVWVKKARENELVIWKGSYTYDIMQTAALFQDLEYGSFFPVDVTFQTFSRPLTEEVDRTETPHVQIYLCPVFFSVFFLVVDCCAPADPSLLHTLVALASSEFQTCERGSSCALCHVCRTILRWLVAMFCSRGPGHFFADVTYHTTSVITVDWLVSSLMRG